MSLLKLEGARLDGPHERRLEAFRLQRERYAGLVADLRRACPSLYQIKGFHVQDLYPPGVLRDSNDLDLVVPDPGDMPGAVRLLLARGFEPLLCGVDLVPDGRLAYHLGMRSTRFVSADHPRADYVELANYSLVGNHLVPLSFVDLRAVPGAAFANLLATLCERFEQPHRTRDLIDARLSLERLRPRKPRSWPARPWSCAWHRSSRSWRAACGTPAWRRLRTASRWPPGPRSPRAAAPRPPPAAPARRSADRHQQVERRRATRSGGAGTAEAGRLGPVRPGTGRAPAAMRSAGDREARRSRRLGGHLGAGRERDHPAGTFRLSTRRDAALAEASRAWAPPPRATGGGR
jgi:hypothetical protein